MTDLLSLLLLAAVALLVWSFLRLLLRGELYRILPQTPAPPSGWPFPGDPPPPRRGPITTAEVERDAIALFESYMEDKEPRNERAQNAMELAAGAVLVRYSPPYCLGPWPFDVYEHAKKYLRSYWRGRATRRAV